MLGERTWPGPLEMATQISLLRTGHRQLWPYSWLGAELLQEYLRVVRDAGTGRGVVGGKGDERMVASAARIGVLLAEMITGLEADNMDQLAANGARVVREEYARKRSKIKITSGAGTSKKDAAKAQAPDEFSPAGFIEGMISFEETRPSLVPVVYSKDIRQAHTGEEAAASARQHSENLRLKMLRSDFFVDVVEKVLETSSA